MSIGEEVEQDIISKSVKVNTNYRTAIATLPLVYDPVTKFALKEDKSRRVYHQQLKLNVNPQDKNKIKESEAKL